MGLFDSLLGKKKTTLPGGIRETLFGDLALDQWPQVGSASEAFPWSAFVAARAQIASGDGPAAVANWREVLEHPGLEPRHYLQAWHFLRQHGQLPPTGEAKQVLGVVVEVAMKQGLDLLAAYADHSARYYNYSGAGVVWDHPDTSLDAPIEQLLEASRVVVDLIGPWEQARPAPPPRGQARMAFLTPSGLHFGQGEMGALGQDPLGGRVLQLATVLMQALVAKTKA